MDLERLYAALPVSLQEAAICLEGRRIQRNRYNASFHRLLEEYHARTFWSRDEIAAWRDRRIAAFVAHASRTVPYYRDLFRDLGATPQDFKTLEDLTRLPILDKQTVQAQPERFLSEAAGDWETMSCHTSGTTGAGLHFTATRDSQREHWAVWWRYRGWHGLQLDEPCLYFGGRSIVPPRQQRPPFWRHNRPGRQWLFSAYHLSPENALAYIDAIRRSGARWIHGYPSLVALLAAYILQFGGNFEMRWVTLGAENVLPQQAELIERAFGVRPLSHYSMAEGVANISQCPAGNHHTDEDFAAVEFLPQDSGPSCRVLGTNLSNPAFPLLRYDTGDLAVPVEGECACGRPGRLVAAIDGRMEDVVVTKRGARLGRLDHLFKDMVHIREAQVRQTRPGHIELHIVRGPQYSSSDEQHLRQEIHKRTGDDLDYDLCYTDSLPRTPSGKLRFVISGVKPDTDCIPKNQ